MLRLSTAQVSALEDAAGLQFIDEARCEAEGDYPGVFEDQPLFVRRCMVANGFACAGRLGFNEQASLRTFLSLQCGFAPDFHTHPAVAGLLAAEGEEGERLAAVLALPDDVWDQVDTFGSELAWFDPPAAGQRDARIAFHACGALPQIMQAHDDAGAHALFSGAWPAAARHGIDWEEGVAVFAAALALYGPRFDRDGVTPWAPSVFTLPPSDPETVVGLLRYRLNLDFGGLA